MEFGRVFTAMVGFGEGREEMQATLSRNVRTRLQAAHIIPSSSLYKHRISKIPS